MWKLYRRHGRNNSENKKGWKYYSKMLLLVLYFHFDHWIKVISCKYKIYIFFYRQKHLMFVVSIFLLQEKLTWYMKDDKIPQTIVIVPATVKTIPLPSPLPSYYTVSLCDISCYEVHCTWRIDREVIREDK